MAEPYLGNPLRCETVLRKFGFSFRKKFGQNFLIDSDVLEGIVDAAAVDEEDVVLEIGPGIGSLTQYLASRARRVISVEIDRALLPILDYTLADWDNVRIINNDILKTDIRAIAGEENGGRPLKVIANLPYYITTPIIMKLFENGAPSVRLRSWFRRRWLTAWRRSPAARPTGPSRWRCSITHRWNR